MFRANWGAFRVRHWNRLSLTLPLGLAVAALYFPLRLVLAANSPPTGIQAALRVGPDETTPHFFTGDTRLSSFQRLPEAVQHPLQPTAVSAASVSNVNQLPVEHPRPGLTPAIVNAVATAQVPPQQLERQQQPPSPAEAAAQLPLGKPIAWEGEQRIDAHFFPKHTPLRFAGYFDPVTPANLPRLSNQSELQTPLLRAAEIQPVGAAQIAIAPHQQPPSQQPVPIEPPAPLGRPIAWDGEHHIDTHYFPNHSPLRFAAYSEPVAPLRLPALAHETAPPASHLRTTEIQPVGAAQVAIAPPPQQQPPSDSIPIHSQFVSTPPIIATATSNGLASPPPTIAAAPSPEQSAPAAKTVALENKRPGGAHYFGPMRLASLERQPANLQAPPLKETLVQPANAPNLPPADPTPVAPPQIPLPPIAAAPQQPIKPQLISLERPELPRLHPTAVATLPPPSQSLAPLRSELTSLITSGPQPISPLVPAEVLPAASPPPLQEQFRLVALQPLPAPGVNLQPTEVLPIPTPYSPTAPRVPTAIDAERPISAVTTNISDPSGRMPTDLAIDRFRGDYPAYLPRDWESSVYFWDAPSMCIGPLRYEEVNLERFGYSHCPAIQPVLSGMHFLGATMALPYSIAARPFGTCEYPLGHYRPGSPVPFRHIRPELRPWPAAAECMTIAGLILLIP